MLPLFCTGHKRIGGVVQTVFTLLGSSLGIHCKPCVFPEENGSGCMSMWQAWCDVLHNIFLLLEGFVERSCFLSSVWTFYSSVAHSYTLTVTTVILGYIWTKFFLVFSSVGYRKITVTGAHVNWWKPFGSIPRTLTRSWLDTAGAWLSSGTCRITKWHTSSWAARYEFIQFSRGGRALSAQSTPKTSRYRESLTKLLFLVRMYWFWGG